MKWLVGLIVVTGMSGCQRAKPVPVEKAPPESIVETVGPVGIPACDDYLRRVAACTKLTPGARATFAHGTTVWKQAADAKGDSAKVAGESCESAAKLAAPVLAQLGC
ncbi:MAG: hypothetical protein JWO36_1457 [Myxococcales bacterium]|nr:hypothetical protein [Myxococcales bacterium]